MLVTPGSESVTTCNNTCMSGWVFDWAKNTSQYI